MIDLTYTLTGFPQLPVTLAAGAALAPGESVQVDALTPEEEALVDAGVLAASDTPDPVVPDPEPTPTEPEKSAEPDKPKSTRQRAGAADNPKETT